LPLLRDGSAIVLNSSTTGTTGNENFSVYGASKAAVRSFARSWILDLKARRIRVNVLSPGATRTPGLLGLVPSEQGAGLVDALVSTIPLGRVAEPREIAEAALFLASDLEFRQRCRVVCRRRLGADLTMRRDVPPMRYVSAGEMLHG
jgi:NAD(P)-dependent dehydrogenase (short-subunit alcohol dehydrogenase family)